MGYRLVFGLSADPIHTGHVAMVAQSARRLTERGYDLAEILLVPVYRRNPVGSTKERLPDVFHQRFVMCGLAAREIARQLGIAPDLVRVSAIEAELARHRTRPNYTAETLAVLKARSAPGEGLLFLISSELVSGPNPEFARWHRPRKILKLSRLVVCPRPGYPLNRRFVQAMVLAGGEIVVLPHITTPDVSSTRLRRLLEGGLAPLALGHRGLMPMAVARYLTTHNFYSA